jgi:hypothetical protein
MGHYVVASDEYLISRCRLPSSAPFDLGVHHSIRDVFDRLKNKKLLRIAEHPFPHGGNAIKGVVFDFGDIRVLGREQGSQDLVPLISKEFEIPVEALVKLPRQIKKTVELIRKIAKKGKDIPSDESMVVTLEKNRLVLECENEGRRIRRDVPIETYRPLRPISFTTVPLYFKEAATASGMLGYKKDSKNGYVAYFRNRTSEHLVGRFEL